MPKNREPLPDFSDVHVRLKPFLGMAPGAYLTVLYAVALLVLVFLFLLLPGIRANGTVVSFASEPRGAAVWIDGDYRGATPCDVFVRQGAREVELRKAFYKSATIKKKFSGRIFGTLLFPRRERITARMVVGDPQGLVSWTAEQVAEWSLLRDFSLSYQIPPYLSESAGALARLRDPAALAGARSLLLTAAAGTDSEAELRELVAATAAYSSRGALLSSEGVGRMLRAAVDFNRTVASFPLWVAQALDGDNPLRVSLLASTALSSHTRRVLEAARRWETTPAVAAGGGAPVVAGIRFLPVSGGVQLVGRAPSEAAARIDAFLPVPMRVEPFWLGETEVTRDQFAQFLMADPRWSDRLALMRDGLVTSAYLEGWEGTRYPAGTGALPAVGVSYYAAVAFCSWLTRQLPQALAGYEVRLPSEAEWQRAAGSPPPPENAAFLGAGSLKPVGASQPGPHGQRDLWGNAWEWCSDAYFPVRNLLSSLFPGAPDPLAGAVGVERVVKGGSWANSRDDFGSFVRGSQPPDWCTPYTGFRAALARRPAAPARR